MATSSWYGSVALVSAIETHMSRWTAVLHLLQVAIMTLAVLGTAVLLYTAATSVLSTSIWSYFEQANWAMASALSLVAMIVVLVFMWLLMVLTRVRPGKKA